MGCTPSKLDNEDTVRRCKERHRLMKEAVFARHHLAAAHSDYCRSLRITGSALVTFASALPQKFDEKFTYDARANSTYSSTPSQGSSVWNWDNFYPPPSPPDSEYFQKLQNNKNSSRIHEEQDNYNNDCYTNEEDDDKESVFTSNSQVRDPDDHFQNPFSSSNGQFDDKASNYSSYSHYSDNSSSYARNPTSRRPVPVEKEGHHLKSEEEETEREEVQCSDWGDHDHCSSTTSSSNEDEEEDLKSRSDVGTWSNFGSVKNEAAPLHVGNENVNLNSKFSRKSDKLSSGDGKSSFSWGNGDYEGMNSDRRIVVRHKDLAEIVNAIREYFDKAASAGEQVSEMLETGRAQLDRNFNQLKKTVYHSSGMLSNLSSSWTSKPPLAVKYRLDPRSIDQPGGPKSLSSTLERLLAWEKKLYQEVKARERVKIEHEKKLSALQSQEYRGNVEAKLDQTKASIQSLQSLIVVTSQAVSTTSSAITGLRDSDLVPQLVELCHGFMYMWRSMHQVHEVQNDIVQQVRGLVNRATKGESTSNLHRQATRDLESAVSAWHSSFCRLIKFQQDFIRSLHGWFKLTLLPVNNTPSNDNLEQSEVFAFCDEWKLTLDRIPNTVASEAIKSFINVVHSISLKQTEELKIKKRTETASKELEKKASSLRNIEKKYYHSYSMVGIGLPDTVPDNGLALDARDPLADKKAELATCQIRVEDEMLKHSKAVEVTRAMTLNNIQTGLPGVFQSMASFSALITEALEAVCVRSYAIK
ncbi:hypothetical protein Fot_27947 [Forsythia ovata]|uniref:Uncharacterized protein n=1 Tax=Forsythia ovata TaxID=205694 RepID=A0ABD1TML0_9LAMI